MTIYAYNLPQYTHEELSFLFPDLVFIRDTSQLKNMITKDDLFICMWDDVPTLQLLETLHNPIFPSKDVINFSANRELMSKFVNQHSMFPCERDYVSFKGTEFVVTIPKLNNSLKVVAKVGEGHRGQNKFCMYPGQELLVKDSVVFEEFIESAQSYRILLIGDDIFVIEYHDDPYRPKSFDQNWIKNINPILLENTNHSLFKKEIGDTLHMANILNYRYLGVDYVKNPEKTVCVEVNTFPGVRLNERTRNAALNYWKNQLHEFSK